MKIGRHHENFGEQSNNIAKRGCLENLVASERGKKKEEKADIDTSFVEDGEDKGSDAFAPSLQDSDDDES